MRKIGNCRAAAIAMAGLAAAGAAWLWIGGGATDPGGGPAVRPLAGRWVIRPCDLAADAAAVSPAARSIRDRVAEAIRLIGTDAERAAELLEAALEGLTAADLSEVLAMIERGVPCDGEHKRFYETLLRRWARFDGWAAVQYTVKNVPESVRLSLAVEAMRGWGSRNPRACVRRIATLPEYSGRDYLLTYGAPVMFAESDPVAGVEWARDLEGGVDLRANAQSEMMASWLTKDPQAALDWTLRNCEPGTGRVFIREAVRHLSPEGCDKIDAWASGFRDDAARTLARVATVENLALAMPERVGEWLNRFKAGQDMDEAFARFAEAIAGSDPEVARGWAEDITDAALREQTMRSIEQR